MTIKFTLHTEPQVDPPEFTVTYRSQGGPVTYVQWTVNGNRDALHQSQLILDTSNNSVYANRLHVRGRTIGTCSCRIFAFGKDLRPLYERRFMTFKIEGKHLKISGY